MSSYDNTTSKMQEKDKERLQRRLALNLKRFDDASPSRPCRIKLLLRRNDAIRSFGFGRNAICEQVDERRMRVNCDVETA